MNRATSARVAGLTFLLYIGAGLLPAPTPRVGVLFSLLQCFCALTLAGTLYSVTSTAGAEIAVLGMVFRTAEGVLGALFLPFKLASLSIPSTAIDAHAASTLTDFFGAARGWNPVIGAFFFAVGSLLFSWLMVRGRIVPAVLAWLGVISSAILIIGLPLQILGSISGTASKLMWIPAALFEVPLGLWLVVKGVPAAVEDS